MSFDACPIHEHSPEFQLQMCLPLETRLSAGSNNPLMKRAALFLLFCAIVGRLLGVAVGDSRDALIKELGEPANHMAAGNGEILQYPAFGRITLRNGVVTQIDRTAPTRAVVPSTSPKPADGIADEAHALIEESLAGGPPKDFHKKVEKSSIDNHNYVKMQQGKPVELKYSNQWDAAADARRKELELKLEPIDFIALDVIPGKVVFFVGAVHSIACMLFAALSLLLAFRVFGVIAHPNNVVAIAATHGVAFFAVFSAILYFSGTPIEKTPISQYIFTAIAATSPVLVLMINRASEVCDWSGSIRAALATGACLGGMLYAVDKLLPAARVAAWIL